MFTLGDGSDFGLLQRAFRHAIVALLFTVVSAHLLGVDGGIRGGGDFAENIVGKFAGMLRAMLILLVEMARAWAPRVTVADLSCSRTVGRMAWMARSAAKHSLGTLSSRGGNAHSTDVGQGRMGVWLLAVVAGVVSHGDGEAQTGLDVKSHTINTGRSRTMNCMEWRTRVFTTVLAVALGPAILNAADSGSVVIRELRGESLTRNLIGTNPVRKLAVYLPPGYASSTQRYPVIYYLPSPVAKFDEELYQGPARELLDRATAAGEIGKTIFVAVDMATPLGCSWYVNSPVTGNWEDFMVRELVPYVDSHFRTFRHRDSRGIMGDFMGGYGAIRFGMTHPEVFGTVYALHPVGTGSGIYTMYSRPDWKLFEHIQSMDELKNSPYAVIFTSIFQAGVPDVNKPPLYIDLQAHPVGDSLEIDSAVTERLRDNFLLETMIGKYADNLKSLRGLRFDWARNDGNQDHVYSNQAFTHKLNEFGIPHEAEEYNGVWGTGNWGADGRVYTEALPFFARHLVFNPPSVSASTH